MYHTSECGCGHEARHTPHSGGHHHQGCCCATGYPHRRFPTREEIIARLEEYLKQLQAEVKGVEERIAELQKAD